MDMPDGAFGYTSVLSAAAAFVTACSMAYVRISRTHLDWWKAKHPSQLVPPPVDSVRGDEHRAVAQGALR